MMQISKKLKMLEKSFRLGDAERATDLKILQSGMGLRHGAY